FFQAEDGIRDRTVTGVQTCALPICAGSGEEGWGGGLVTAPMGGWGGITARGAGGGANHPAGGTQRGRGASRITDRARPQDGRSRSEERRVGKEWRARAWRWREERTR